MATKNGTSKSVDIDTSVLIIPLSKLVVRPEDNARKVMKDIGKLAGDMKQEGQLTPVLVQEIEGGKYRLMAGFRRIAAIKMNKGKTVRAQLYEGDEKACDLMNLKENVAREDLTTYELAWACLRMKEKHKMSGAKIADALRGMKGMGKSYVNRLLACATRGPDYVITAWADPDNPAHGAATIENMEKVIALKGSPSKAAEEWAKFCGLGSTGDGEGGGGDGGGGQDDDNKPPKPPRRLKVDELAQAMAAVKAAVTEEDISEEEAEGAIGVLKWAMGKVKSLRIDGVTVYDPAKAAKAAKAKRDAEKEADKAKKAKERDEKKAERLREQLAELEA
jgi:ParB/RepB/Spo0J family partition protein